jgi:hypothetical protein
MYMERVLYDIRQSLSLYRQNIIFFILYQLTIHITSKDHAALTVVKRIFYLFPDHFSLSNKCRIFKYNRI